MTCDRCGATLEIGAFPFCKGQPSDHGRGVGAVHGDEMDHVQVNGTREPIRFTSKAERRAWLKANGLEEAVRHVPLAGSDKSPHTIDWTSRMDPYTANNVRILLERAFHAGVATEDPPMSVTTEIHDLTPEEQRRYAR